MMAYHQRVNQFKSRIDFDDPSTTKPPSLAKSAVLQALEEEERQQQSRGKGGGGAGFLLQQSRPSRSRQREPVAAAERARTPCINRDTVLRINRRPVRHRSCDSFWPPAKTAARSPSPRGQLGGAEGGSFAYDVGAYGGHYGSHESVYFDERVRKQHKIDPLRTMFDKANVVLEDWGGRRRVRMEPPESPSKRLSDNGVYDGRRQEKVVGGDDDAGNNSVKQGEMIESEKNLPEEDVPPPRPPSPPPRRYFLPMDQLQSGVGIEILLRCYGAAINQSESQEISTFKIDDGGDSRQQAKQQQPLPPPPPPPTFSSYPEDRALHQDGIQSKPPLKSRATPTKRAPSKPPTPTIGHASHSDDPAPASTSRDEFNINSNTILNLNIDNTSPSTAVPQITVTDCPQQQPQQPRGATSKTNDQLWHEIIDEHHNYNEKLITNSGGLVGVAEFAVDDPQFQPHDPLAELPNEQHSKLNVSNQANRNWINLNSNEIYPHSSSSSATDCTDAAAARVTKTRVRRASDANDAPTLTVIRSDNPRPVDNYDNKSIKSNYWIPDVDGDNNNASNTGLANPGSSRQLRRSESRDSARSWRVDEVLEFPPPPPYLCDCDDAGSSGRCSVEAQSHIVALYSVGAGSGDNPTISQSCRQDSTADVRPSFGGDRWDDNHAGATTTATAATADDYFKTNLTDDKFLNENVNTACNLRRSKSKHRQLYCSSNSGGSDQASSSLHKSIDAFLAHERHEDGLDHPQMSFTDGEYIFGPYDERSEEFRHFNLWSSEFRQLRRNCRHQQGTHEGGGGSNSSSSGTATLVPPHPADGGSSCSCSVISSSDTLREDSKTPEWRQHRPAPGSKQVENYDDDGDGIPGNVPAGNVPPPAATSYQHRWVRFENGSVCPPSTPPTAPLTRVPTPYPSPTGSPTAKEDVDHDEIFDRFAEQLKSGDSTDESAAMVENVPLIDAVLDDLLTFSRNLSRDDDDDNDDGEGRAAAKIVEINDDNLINLLADDDNADAGVGRGRTQANEDSCKTSPEKDSADGLGKSLPSKPRTPLGSFSANNADVDGEKCDQNANEARKLRHRDVSEDNYLNREDVFTNVAIFSWNPLDVYQQHGLFMIDPRFALADLHATTGGCNASTDDDAHSSSTAVHGRRPEDDTDATTASSSIGMPALTDGADPSSDADVNSFATQRGDVLLLESHKIPNVGSPARSPATVDHFYDSAHVEYPVRPDLSLSSSSATTKECHQSPPSPPPPPLVESDYDNDLAKCNPQDGEDRQEGLKRVAWPPSAEGGDEYEQVQQQQQPQQQQQQQQYYQQPQAQHQPAPTYQQYQQPAHQQQQPRERIIPIQRTTSHISPQRTPKSPLGGGHQQPRYPPQQQQQPHHQRQPAGSSTVAFSGGRAVLPQQAQPQQQQQYYQPAPRPVSAPYHQQVQQQNRYSSPSTASLGSPRSPQIVGGGHSPRGWAHVQSPVPVYRPAPQQHPYHQQQQSQQYVPPPFQTEPNPTAAYQRQASGGFGPRKPDQQQSPASPQQPQYQPQPTQAFQPLVSQQQQQQFYQQPEQQQQLHQHQQPEPVPFFTTLRSEPPMSQEPAPVYQAEPAAAIYQGGSNMRGDQKWPPAEVKKQSELENEERRRLAQEPAFRPRKVQKDYTNFFAKNALNQTYPGYRAPPGTQHHS